MRKNRRSRFKMYLATTLLAFMIPAVFSMILVLKNKQKYLDNIISYINKASPVDISIADISVSYRMEIILDDVKLYSKNNQNPFFDMNRASLRFNPLRLLANKDIFYMVSETEIDNANFYPALFDNSILKRNGDKSSENDLKSKIENIMPLFMDKNIRIRNFSTKIVDDNGEATEISLNSLNGNFRTYRYFLSYNIDLPDKTSVYVSIESEPDLSEINSIIDAKDEKGQLFKYNLDFTNDYNNKIEGNLKDYRDILANLIYDYNDKRLDFSFIDIDISKNAVYKLLNIALDTPIVYKFIELDDKKINNISNAINGFDYANINVKGSKKTNENLYLDMDLKAKDDFFDLFVKAELTNDNIILSNAKIDLLNGNIIASGIIPLKEPISSRLELSVNEIYAGINNLSSKLTLKPLSSSKDRITSRFTIEELSYASALKEPLAWNIIYKIKEKEIAVNLIENQYKEPLIANISLDDTKPTLAEVYGTVPQDIFVALIGRNPIDNLSSLNINYNMSNGLYTEGKGNIHSLELASRKIYTEEYLIRIGALFYSNVAEINDIYYKISDNGDIKAKANIEYDKNLNVKINGNVESPVGKYSLNGFTLIATNGDRIIHAATEKSEIVANGSITKDGILNLNIKTPKELSINDSVINADISIDNYTQEPFYIYGDVKFDKNAAPIFTLNTQFESSNQSLVFTNIILDYGANRVSGSGILNNADGINRFTALLKSAENDGGFAISASINKNNIYGKLNIADLPFNLDYVKGIYGILSADATVIGLLNSPIVYLEKFNIKDFEILEDRFDVSFTGYYGKEQLELKDFVMTKTGKSGNVLPRSLIKPQQVKIPYAYFSKDSQNIQIEIHNLFLYSAYNGNINYNMRRLADGSSEYRIQTSPIKINKRTLPEFGTIMVRSDNLIYFTNTESHGINGRISKEGNESKTELSYIYENYEMLNVDGTINEEVDLLLTSDRLNVEIFEIFNVIFTEIQSSQTNFLVNNKPYTLYARVHGDKNDLAIDGRFLGHGKRVKIAYFSDIFDDTAVDFSFNGHKFNVNKLSFNTKRNKNLTVTGEAELFRNNINYMAFDLLSSDEQLGLLSGDMNLAVTRIKGPLHLDMTVGGSIAAPIIGGTLTLMRSDVQLRINNQNTYIRHAFGIESRIYWDFLIEAWNNVRVNHNLVGNFYLEEGSKMRIYSSLMDGIELAGTFNIERGNIYYLQNTYRVENGSITFPDINSSDPIIEVTAFTDKKYYSSSAIYSSDSFESEVAGENVTLYMEMNARLSQILSPDASGMSPVRFYTVPSLGQYQVNQLAGIPQGSFGSREEQMYSETTASLNRGNINNSQINQATQLVSSYGDAALGNVTSTYILRPIERWVSRLGIIDSISFNPTIVNNFSSHIFTNNNNLSFYEVLNNTSAGIGKTVSKYLYMKYDITYKSKDPSRPNMMGRPENSYYFDHKFGFEISLLKNYRLANLSFEYKINPFNILLSGQDFNMVARWRF